MARKGILSLILSGILCLTFFGSAIRADDEHPDMYVFSRDFTYNEEKRLYECEYSYYDSNTKCYLLYQENIDDRGGALPDYDGKYFFMEDLTVDIPLDVSHKAISLYHAGHSLKYNSRQPDGYLFYLGPGSSFRYESGYDGYTKIDAEGMLSSDGSPFFDIDNSSYPSISDLIIDGGRDNFFEDDDMGGSLFRVRCASLSITSCEIYNCTAENGAVVRIDRSEGYSYGSVYINLCYFHDCYAINGGCIYAPLGEISLFESEFEDNYAEEKGGVAAILDNAHITLQGVYMWDNMSKMSQGGAIYVNRISDGQDFYPAISITDPYNEILGNYGKYGEENNVYLDCSRCNEESSSVNAIKFEYAYCSEETYIGISYNPDYPPKTIIYPVTGNMYRPELKDVSGITLDDPNLMIVRDISGAFVITDRETSVKGLMAALDEGRIATRVYVCISGDYNINDLSMDYTTKNFASNNTSVKITGCKAKTDPRYPDLVYFTVESDPAFLTEPVSYEIYNGDTKILEGSFDVISYLEAVTTNYNYGSNTIALAERIINYGTAAQEYFKVNTNDLNYTEYAQYDLDYISAEEFQDYEFAEDVKSSDLARFYGASFILSEAPYINYYFLPGASVTDMTQIVVQIDDETVDISYNVDKGYFNIKQRVNVFEFDETHTLSVGYYEDGVFVEEFSFRYSACTYLYKHFNNDMGEDTKLDNLLWYLYQYFNYCVRYRNYVMSD